jgi:hypothetical protein
MALQPLYPLTAAANQAQPATAAGRDDIKTMLLNIKNEQEKFMRNFGVRGGGGSMRAEVDDVLEIQLRS